MGIAYATTLNLKPSRGPPLAFATPASILSCRRLITYLYYLLMWIVYFFLLVAFGSAVGLSLFRKNSYGIQIVLFLLYGNLQISLAFLSSTFYSKAANSVIVSEEGRPLRTH